MKWKPDEKGWWKSAKSAFSSVKGYIWPHNEESENVVNEQEQQLSPLADLDTKSMRKRCLEVYLEKCIRVLQTGILNIEGNDLLENATEIYNSLHIIWVQDGKNLKSTPKQWKYDNFKKVQYIIISPLPLKLAYIIPVVCMCKQFCFSIECHLTIQ